MQPSRAHSVAQRVERAVGISPSSETFRAALAARTAIALGPSRHPQLGSPRSRRLDAGRDLRNTAAVIGAPGPLEPAPPAGLGGRAVHGILALGLEKTVALGIALYLPRHLGLADYGRYAFLLSYLGFFQALPDAALEAVLVARLARAAADEAGALAGRGARVRLAVSLVGGVAGLALLALAVHDAELLCGGVVGAAGLVASAATPYRALLRARLRMSAYVGLLAAQAALAVGLLAAVVVAGGGLVAVFAAVSAAAVAGVGLGRLVVGPGARLAADRAVRRRLIAEAWPLAASTLAVVGAQQILQLLLLRLHGAAEVGLLGGGRRRRHDRARRGARADLRRGRGGGRLRGRQPRRAGGAARASRDARGGRAGAGRDRPPARARRGRRRGRGRARAVRPGGRGAPPGRLPRGALPDGDRDARRPGALAHVTGAPLSSARCRKRPSSSRPTTSVTTSSASCPRCWRRPTATWWWWTTTRPTGRRRRSPRWPPPTRACTS